MTEDRALHLDLDQLADALAGEAGTASAAHLSTCASCTSRLAELEAAEASLLTSLRGLPDPAVPDGLADRLSAVFAAQAPLVAPSPTPGSTVTALPARAPRRRFLPAAAAAVLAVSIGGLGYAVVSSSGGAGSDTGAESAGGGALALPTSSSGTDYADAAAVTGVLPGVLAGAAGAGGAVALDSQVAPESDAVAGAASAPETARSQAQAPAPAAATAGDPLERLRTPQGLADCLAAVLPPEEPDVQPRALDYAQYEGQPALAIVLPDPDPAKLSLYVVGADCAAADARLLGFFRVDAP